MIDVCCGQGEQQARWLANVAVARYDAVNSKGFLKLGNTFAHSVVLGIALENAGATYYAGRAGRFAGGPKRIFKPSMQVDVPFHLKIKDIFEDGDHIVVETIFDDESERLLLFPLFNVSTAFLRRVRTIG